MKNILLILTLIFSLSAMAEVIKGGVVEEYIPEGFFGSWGVISKLKNAS